MVSRPFSPYWLGRDNKEIMTKIFFFQRRNSSTGELLDEYIDATEQQAFTYYRQPRLYSYVGWSTGEFIKGIKIKPAQKDERGISVQPDEETKNIIREAQRQELEFAKNNPDKTPPKDPRKMYIRQSDKEQLERTNWSPR